MPISANPALLLVRIPLLLIKFWLVEGPSRILHTSFTLVRTTASILSIELLLKTLFAPWKGEYRKGYVAIARGIGFIIRFVTLLIGLVIIYIEIIICFSILIAWIGLPIYWTASLILSLGGTP